MNPEYWIGRWERDETGFHTDEVQAGLQAALPDPAMISGRTVFVPLCGKSVDMSWLAGAGATVIGCDLSDRACMQFFETWGKDPVVSHNGSFNVFSAGGVTLYAGDFFSLKPSFVAGADVVFDRAALVALPRAMRKRYTSRLRRLTPAAQIVLISFTYSHPAEIGPPFSVTDIEIESHFGDGYTMRPVDRRILHTYSGSKMDRHGIKELAETTWMLTPDVKIP